MTSDFLRADDIKFSVLIDEQAIDIYPFEGRYFIAGQVGKPYVIQVTNLNGDRRLVLMSVDGRDVLEDQPALLSNHGMVVRGHSTWTNYGWRVDDNTVRNFVFSDPSDSIAAQATGTVSSCGVLGIAVFAEKVYRPLPSTSEWTFSEHKGFGGPYDMGTTRSFSERHDGVTVSNRVDLGTGMGDSRSDSVGHTSFERSSRTPIWSVEIQYRTPQWLKDHGVITEPFPHAFPHDNATGYTKYIK